MIIKYQNPAQPIKYMGGYNKDIIRVSNAKFKNKNN